MKYRGVFLLFWNPPFCNTQNGQLMSHFGYAGANSKRHPVPGLDQNISFITSNAHVASESFTDDSWRSRAIAVVPQKKTPTL